MHRFGEERSVVEPRALVDDVDLRGSVPSENARKDFEFRCRNMEGTQEGIISVTAPAAAPVW